MPDLTEWLRARLAPARAKEESWQELAKAVETFFDAHVGPVVTRLRNLRSLYEMAPEDLDAKIKEMGSLFEAGLIDDKNKPLAVALRRDEISLKNTFIPIASVLARDFNDMDVTWQELWHRKSQPYGTEFLSTQEIESRLLDFNDFYMTMRGIVQISSGDLAVSGVDRDTVIDIIRRKIVAMKPVHIVYDGEVFITIHLIDFGFTLNAVQAGEYTRKTTRNHTVAPDIPMTLSGRSTIKNNTIPWGQVTSPGRMLRMDEMPLDMIPLDTVLE